MDSPVRKMQKRNDYNRHKLLRKIRRQRKAQVEQQKVAAEKELKRRLRVTPPKFGDGKEPTLLDADKVRMNEQGLFQDEYGNIVGDSVVLPELEVTNNNILPEVVVTGYRPIELRTYYPLGRDYPYTGHSQLHIPITEEAADEYGLYDSDDEVPEYRSRYRIRVNKRPYAEDYNLVTNNCADATLGYLNYMFGTKESPYLFTTPGDVRDYAINKLKGKLIKGERYDKVLIPRNKNNATLLSKKALEKYRKTVDNVGTSNLDKLDNRVR